MQNRVQHCDCNIAMGEGKVGNINQNSGKFYRDFHSCKLLASISEIKYSIVIVTWLWEKEKIY